MGGTVAKTAQQGAKNAQDSLSKFVEGPAHHEYKQVPIDESKAGFWDDFSAIADEQNKPPNAIGTSAMAKRGNRTAKPKDEWDEW